MRTPGEQPHSCRLCHLEKNHEKPNKFNGSGGQRGHAPLTSDQWFASPNPKIHSFENMGKIDALPNLLSVAVEWLSKHRDTIKTSPVPAVRAKFGLSNLAAVEALRRSRALRAARNGMRIVLTGIDHADNPLIGEAAARTQDFRRAVP